MADQNQITTTQKRDIKSFIQSDTVREQVALALPKFLTPDRLLRICVTSVNRNPKLLECTPESLLGAIMTAAQMGLEPDGRNGHLIPYNNKGTMEAQFQADYKGLVALVRRNDDVLDVYADVVREHDKFTITKGLHRDLVHEIDIRAERGAIIGAYAVIQYRGGTSGFEFMSKSEIEAIRARSKSANAGPWATDFGEMAKKTVIKRLLKLADLSPETHERLSVDTEISINDRVTEIPRAQIPVAAPMIEPGEPTPRGKKKLPAAEKKKAAEPIEVMPDISERPQLTKLTALVSESGYTPEQLFEVAKDNNWVQDDWTKMADLPEENLKAFVDDWENAERWLTEKFSKPGEKGPFA